MQNWKSYIDSRIPQTCLKHFAQAAFDGLVFQRQRDGAAGELRVPKTLQLTSMMYVSQLLGGNAGSFGAGANTECDAGALHTTLASFPIGSFIDWYVPRCPPPLACAALLQRL